MIGPVYSFRRETVDADRLECIAAGDVDGFMAAEISARIFEVAPHLLFAVCNVEHFPDRAPMRLVSVMPGAWSSEMRICAPAVANAVKDLRSMAAVELLPPTLV